MTDADNSSPNTTHNEHPQSRDEPRKRLWLRIKTPLHLLLGQVIAWALRRYLG